ncbi:Hypothetical protein D9617_23g006010 [Elsinoe fawcettii]|nr:Hypothetical protein D9617_23g006010 [Elsinoe fawcettii]
MRDQNVGDEPTAGDDGSAGGGDATPDPNAGGGTDPGTSPDTGAGGDAGSGTPTTADDSGAATPSADGGDGGTTVAPTSPADDSTTSTADDSGAGATSPAVDNPGHADPTAVVTGDSPAVTAKSATTRAATRVTTKPATAKATTPKSSLTKPPSTIANAPDPTEAPPAPTSELTTTTTTTTTTATTTTTTTTTTTSGPYCTNAPIATSDLFYLYAAGTGTNADNTPLQGLKNGQTSVGFNVGYSALTFSYDCLTGYLYWGNNAALSGNSGASTEGNQLTAIAPLDDPTYTPLQCLMDANLGVTCQYLTDKIFLNFTQWRVARTAPAYLTMAQNTTSTTMTLRAVPLTSTGQLKYAAHTANSDLVVNPNFDTGVMTPWNQNVQGRSGDITFDMRNIVSQANNSCSPFAGTLRINSNTNFMNGYAWGSISQPSVTAFMGEKHLLQYDVYLNYPVGLPAGVRCDVEVKVGDVWTVSYDRYDSTSQPVISFSGTSVSAFNGTGKLAITSYCSGKGTGPWPNVNVGFNNVRLVAAYDRSTYDISPAAQAACPYVRAKSLIVASSYQPFCSGLLEYQSAQSTLTSTTTLQSTATSTLTTTTLVATTVRYRRRKRDVPPVPCDHDHSVPPDMGPVADAEDDHPMTSTTEAAPGIAVATQAVVTPAPTLKLVARDVVSTPTLLTTIPQLDLLYACSSVVPSPTGTMTVTTTSTLTLDPTTISTTVTVTSFTTISLASSAPTGTVGYLRADPVINANSPYVMSDAAHHMTDNFNNQNGRESMIVTSLGQLYSVTFDRYYYYSAPAGGSLILWSSDTSISSRNWESVLRPDGKTQVFMKDERTPGAYYQVCIMDRTLGGDGGSTGLHYYYYAAGATLPARCKLTTMVFEAA